MKKKILGIVLSVSIVLSLFVGMGITPVSATTIPLSSGRVAYESFEYMTDASAANFFTASNEGEATVTQNIVTGGKSGKALALSVNLPNALSKVNYQSSKITFSNDVAGVKLWYNLDKEVTSLKFGLFDLTDNKWTDIVFADYTAGNHEKELYFYSFVGSNFEYSHEYVLAFEDCGDADSAKSYVLTIDDFTLIKKDTGSYSENFDSKNTDNVKSFFTNKNSYEASFTTSISEDAGVQNTKALKFDMNVGNGGWSYFNAFGPNMTISNNVQGMHVFYTVSKKISGIRFGIRKSSDNTWPDVSMLVGTNANKGTVEEGKYDKTVYFSKGQLGGGNQLAIQLDPQGTFGGAATIIIDEIFFIKTEVLWNFNGEADGSSNFFSKIATNNATATQSIANNGEDSTKALAVNMKMSSKYDRVNLVSKALDIPYEACGVRVWYHLDKDVSNFRFGLKNATTDAWTNLMFEGSKTERVDAKEGTYADKILYLNGSEFDFANQYALAVEALGVDGKSVDCTLTIDNITFITKTNIGMQKNFESDNVGTLNYFTKRNSDGRDTVQTVVENAGRNGSKALRVALGSGSAGWYNIHTEGFNVPNNVVGMRIWFRISCDAKVRVQMKRPDKYGNYNWANDLAFVGGSDGQKITAGTYCKTISYSASSNATYALGLEVQSWATGNSPVVEIDDFQFIYAESSPSNNFDNATSANYFTQGGKADSVTYTQSIIDNGGMYGTKALEIKTTNSSGWFNIQTANFNLPSGAIGMHAWYTVSKECPNLRFLLRDINTAKVWTNNGFEGNMDSGAKVAAGTYDKTIFFKDANFKSTWQFGLEVNGIPDGGVTITIDAIEFIYAVGSTHATKEQLNTFKNDIASLNNFDHEDYLNNDSLTAYNTVYTLANSIPQNAVVNSTLNEIKAELATAKSAIVMKAEQQAPVAPVLTKRTSKKLTLSEVAGCEYSIDGTNWAAELSYADLTTGNTYTVYQRVSRTDTHLASPASTLDVKLYAAGDIDNSDSVNATDLLALKKHLLGIEKAQDEVFDNFAANANEDEDGTIDIRDLVAIKKIASGEVA